MPETGSKTVPALDPALSRDCHLVHQVGPAEWSYSVLANTFHAVLDGGSQPIADPGWSETPLLHYAYDRVTRISLSRFVTVVPAVAAPDDGTARGHLALLFRDLPPGSTVRTEALHLDDDLVIVFAEDDHPAVDDLHPDTTVSHAMTGLLRHWHYYARQIASGLFVHVEDGLLIVGRMNERGVELANTYPVEHPEDAAFILLHLYDGLDLDPETVPLVRSGLPATDTMDLVADHVRTIQPMERPISLRYAPGVEQLDGARFVHHYARLL